MSESEALKNIESFFFLLFFMNFRLFFLIVSVVDNKIYSPLFYQLYLITFFVLGKGRVRFGIQYDK